MSPCRAHQGPGGAAVPVTSVDCLQLLSPVVWSAGYAALMCSSLVSVAVDCTSPPLAGSTPGNAISLSACSLATGHCCSLLAAADLFLLAELTLELTGIPLLNEANNNAKSMQPSAAADYFYLARLHGPARHFDRLEPRSIISIHKPPSDFRGQPRPQRLAQMTPSE